MKYALKAMMHIKIKNWDTKKRPFSLIEFLVACMVITICAGMCVTSFFKNAQERKVQAVIRSIEKTLATSYQIAKQTHSEVRVNFNQSEPYAMRMELDDAIQVSDTIKKVARFEKKLEGASSITSRAFLPNAKSNTLIFYHWGTRFPKETLEVTFTNGTSHSIPLETYQKVMDPQAKQEEYPYAVIEKEKKDLYAH